MRRRAAVFIVVACAGAPDESTVGAVFATEPRGAGDGSGGEPRLAEPAHRWDQLDGPMVAILRDGSPAQARAVVPARALRHLEP
jgi:hypothetical protein